MPPVKQQNGVSGVQVGVNALRGISYLKIKFGKFGCYEQSVVHKTLSDVLTESSWVSTLF